MNENKNTATSSVGEDIEEYQAIPDETGELEAIEGVSDQRSDRKSDYEKEYAEGDSQQAEEAHMNLAIARRGEEAAACYLRRRGYVILERNWSCLYGEADIICESEDEDCIVFVEVKTRSGISKGMPEEAVTPKKRSKYERIAACYLQSYAQREMRLRFDIISILTLNDDYAILKHFVNAFGAV